LAETADRRPYPSAVGRDRRPSAGIGPALGPWLGSFVRGANPCAVDDADVTRLAPWVRMNPTTNRPPNRNPNLSWDVFQATLELIHSLRVPLAQLSTKDADLVGQIRRAASSIGLNLSEGKRRTGTVKTDYTAISTSAGLDHRDPSNPRPEGAEGQGGVARA
jgi:hypothetical protein